MNLLLLSSSYSADGKYLEYCQAEIKSFLDSCPPGHVIFVAYALRDLDKYAATAKKFFVELDQPFLALHQTHDARQALQTNDVKAIFVGGGNTFRLLKALQDNGLLNVIKQKVRQGAGYLGASAGSNLACPTIMTTNDMPIVEPKNFQALGLVNFQINAHFVPGALIKNHQGETRELRIRQYHEENDYSVIGLPETSWIRVKGEEINLGGQDNATIFEKNAAPHEWPVHSRLAAGNIELWN